MSEEHSQNAVNPIEAAKRFQSQNQGQICRFSSYRIENPEEFTSHDYSDFSPIKHLEVTAEDYFLPDLLGGSDYSGCSVHRSNHRAFLQEFGDVAGVHEVYGERGTFAVAVRLDVDNPELWETLEALTEYPAVDDEDVSLLEFEEQQEAWENWAAWDYRKELEKRFECDMDPIDAETLSEIFRAVCAEKNEYWIDENGSGGPWIDVAKIAELTAWEILANYGAEKEDPCHV